MRGIDPGDFAAHVVSDERVLELAMIVLDAATRSSGEDDFLMLARLMADGSFASDQADIDDAAYVAGAVSHLTVSHLRVLRLLAAPSNPSVMRYDTLTKSSKYEDLKEPIRIDLLDLILIQTQSHRAQLHTDCLDGAHRT